MTLKIAFAGTGYISKAHAQAARSLGLELVAVVNHRPASMAQYAQEFAIPRQYPTIEALLAAGDVDAVVISTPNFLHAPQTIAALQAGVHVMVEKPMSMNAAEAEAMQAASQASGARLMVGHCWRFDEEVLWLKQQLESGQLGQVIRTKSCGVHVNWGPGGWFTQSQYAGGGALADMGIHAIDTTRFLLGDPQPVSVYAHIGTHYGSYDVDDTGTIIVTWDNGVTSYVESGWWQPHADGPEASTQLYGSQGFARLFPTYLSLPDRAAGEARQIDSGFPPMRDPHCPQAMYDAQLAYFAGCIQSGKNPVPGAAEGLVNMRIVDAAYASSQSGKVIQL